MWHASPQFVSLSRKSTLKASSAASGVGSRLPQTGQGQASATGERRKLQRNFDLGHRLVQRLETPTTRALSLPIVRLRLIVFQMLGGLSKFNTDLKQWRQCKSRRPRSIGEVLLSGNSKENQSSGKSGCGLLAESPHKVEVDVVAQIVCTILPQSPLCKATVVTTMRPRCEPPSTAEAGCIDSCFAKFPFHSSLLVRGRSEYQISGSPQSR